MFKNELDQLNLLVESIFHRAKDSSHKNWVHLLSEDMKLVTDSIHHIGQQAYDFISNKEAEKEPSSDLLSAYQCNFYWMEQAKFFVILWRDVLLEHQKARVLFQEEKTTLSAIQTLQHQSQEVILQAAEELTQYFEQTPISTLATSERKFWRKHEAQTNPFPVYKKQIEELYQQTSTFEEETQKLLLSAQEFHRIEHITKKSIADCLTEIRENQSALEEAIDFVNENAASAPSKIVKHLEQESKELAELADFPSRLSALIKKETDIIPTDVLIPLASQGGMIQVKELNIRRSTRQWLEAEILPQLYEILEITKNIRTNLQLSLLNVHNRALLMSNEIKELGQSKISTEDLSRPLRESHTTILQVKDECLNIQSLVNQRLEEEFEITKIYNDKEFLPVPLQNTINRIVFGQTDIVESVKLRWDKIKNKVITFKSDVEREDALSISEKVVRYLERRAPDPNNGQYAAIFLTEGYVGESFRVGREEEIERVHKLVQQWNNGYRGAILLTGQRFSGKTLFGEYILERYFPNNFVVLNPYHEVKIQGRTFFPQENLAEALAFVKKYSEQSRTVVWLDNLGLWSNREHSLAENVKALQKFTDTVSNKIFILVSLSNWLKAHLDKNMDFDRYFQAEINLDFMSKSDIKKAIAIRHGATHAKLLDEKGEEVNSHTFNKMMSATYNHSQGNVGEALMSWVNALEITENGEVRRHQQADPPLPDFITTDTAVLLSSIMLHRYINEYGLSKLFGPAWATKYKGILQRLLGLGLLQRSTSGRLFITPIAVNDIGRLLEKHHYLKFNQ